MTEGLDVLSLEGLTDGRVSVSFLEHLSRLAVAHSASLPGTTPDPPSRDSAPRPNADAGRSRGRLRRLCRADRRPPARSPTFTLMLLEMTVHRHQAVAVIDEQRVAVEEEIAGFDHRACRGRANRRACGGGDVHAGMRIARLAVEDNGASRTNPSARLSTGDCQREHRRVRQSVNLRQRRVWSARCSVSMRFRSSGLRVRPAAGS